MAYLENFKVRKIKLLSYYNKIYGKGGTNVQMGMRLNRRIVFNIYNQIELRKCKYKDV